MALLTAEERKILEIGAKAKYKCDKCKRLILSTLIYATKDGQVACSKSCRDSLDSEIEINLNRGQNKMKYAKKKLKDEEEDDVEEVEEEEEETEEEEEEEESSDDEDDDEEEEKPKKKRGRPAGKKKVEKPAKKAKKSKKDDDDEDEDEKPSKKGKKVKKSKKKDDDDEDDKPKRTVVTGTKDNPFREGSSIATAFDKVKKGMTVKDFKKFAKSEGHDYGWYMARFRKEEKRGVKWSFSEDDDDIKITLKKKK